MTDRFWGMVTLAMHMDGADGSTNFVDEKGHTITRGGNPIISTTQSKFGGASAYFNGAGDYLVLPNGSDWAFGNGDFTVEMFVFTGPPLGGNYLNDKLLFGSFDNTIHLVMFLSHNNNEPAMWDGTFQRTASNGVVPNTWTHVAWTRKSGVLKIFVDGVLGGSWANTKNFTGTNGFKIGSNIIDRHYDGYIDDIRITKGFSRYTQDFTPPTAPFPNTGPPDDSRILTGGLIASRIPAAFRGHHRIYGTIRLEAGPAPDRRVLLYDPRSMCPIAQTFADADGRYEFADIKPGTYLVVGQDRRTHYHPDIVRVDSEPMP